MKHRILKFLKKLFIPLSFLLIILIFLIPVKNKLADIYFQQGNNNFKNELYKSAVLNYEKSLALRGKNHQLKNNLADLYLLKNQTEKAIYYYKESIKDNPNNGYGWQKLIETQISNNQISDLGKNVLRLNLAKLDDNPEKTKIAYARFLLAISETEKSLSVLLEIKNEESIFYQLLIDLSKNNYLSAKNKLSEIKKSKELAEKIEKIENLFAKTDKATNEIYQKTIIGQLLNEVGEPYLAIKLLKEVAENNNKYRDANLFLGYSYLLINDFQLSEKYLLRARENDNLYGLTYYFLGKLYQAKNQLDLARDNYEKSINFGYRSSFLYEQLADIYQKNLQLDQAEKYYKLSLSDKQNFNILSKLAENMILNNKTGQAIKLFEEYKYPAILGRVYLANNDTQKAIEYLEQAKEDEPNSSYVNFYLAEAYLFGNKQSEAKKYYQKTAELDFSGQFAKKSEEKLTNL